MYYDSEKPLKPDSEILAFQIGAPEKDVRLILDSFFILTEGGWRQSRCDQEIADYRAFLEKKSNAGRASAKRRLNSRSTGVQQVFNETSTDVQLTTNQQPLTNNHKPKKEKAVIVSRPDSIDEQLWNDWLIIRKKKDAPLTQTAWDMFITQVNKAGWTVDDAIKECCLRTWASFKADWVAPKQTFAQQAADVARITVPGSTAPDPALVKIEQDMAKAAPMPDHIRQQINSVLRKA